MVYVYKDKIIQLFVAEANRHLKAKVEVGKIDLSLWEKFPQVAITVQNVKISGSLPEITEPLATGKQLYFTFNLKDVLSGKYEVREFSLENGQILVRVQPDGAVNYHVFEPDTASSSEAFKFDLEKITLKNVLLEYDDRQLDQTYQTDAKELVAALKISPEKIAIHAEGQTHIHNILINKSAYFKGKDVVLNTHLDILRLEEKVVIAPSEVKVGQASYTVNGSVAYKNETELDLKLHGRNTNIQSLLSLLPQKFTKPLSKYQSQGNVYFKGVVNGTASGRKSPLIAFEFGCKNASFYHPDYKEKLENISLEGSFSNGKKHNLQTSVLELKNLKGTLRGRPFSANLVYSNFANPDLKLDAKADLDIAHVLALFPQEQVKSGSGNAQVQFAFAGNLNAFRAKPANQTLKASGDLHLKNANLHLKQYAQPFKNLNGTFLLRKNDVAVSDFSGQLGSSDFTLNGYFKNMLGWLLLDNQSLFVQADFDAAFLNFDELLAATGSTSEAGKPAAGQEAEYNLVVSPNLDFNLNAKVKKLQFRRFKSKNVTGTVRLKDQVVSSPNIALSIIGGRFSVKGSLDARSRNNLKASTSTWVEDIRVDSLLYVFENFGQNFLQQRHLKGELTANIQSDLYFDKHLNPLVDKMEADINATLVNGQLVYFEPMQKLSAFADRNELANLRFSELTNHFWIQNRTVYIPEMEIRSNVSRASVIGISGTHTFDQQMDYKFRIPLAKGEKKRDKDERFGNVEVVQAGGPANLFLTLKGSENNYKIAYDQERVKTKLKDDLRKEKQEFVDALKGKKEPEKAVEVKEGEYFNF
ncbi:hypothetical protein F0P94_13520 [Adhaeribacter soli]|uniref:Uncharacterized protein n=2 Tax=Adhaeribacter soli TaxID=2607655 RepID=A0A5N1IVI5_9BACT|nr:hypothetical protein F0P94_13520 [Adhaeribacter soli]